MMATERWNDEEEKDFHSLENQGFARNMEPHHLSLLMLIPPIVKIRLQLDPVLMNPLIMKCFSLSNIYFLLKKVKLTIM